MREIIAPYGFVPLSHVIQFAENPERISHDIPYRDGLSGVLNVEMEATQPLFTRGAQNKEEFFKLPDGTYAVPGSSVRGLLRNTLEIATFGKMNRLNNHRYAVRDLRNPDLYVRHMANILRSLRSGKKEPMPLVGAGWLVKDDKSAFWKTGKPTTENGTARPVAHIVPCSFAKAEYMDIIRWAQANKFQNYSPGDKGSFTRKYRQLSQNRQRFMPEDLATLQVNVRVDRLRDVSGSQEYPYLDQAYRNGHLGEYGRVSSFSGDQKGQLVLTGQPSPWRPTSGPKRPGAGNPKHHDFVFYGEQKDAALPITMEQFKDFEFVHSDRGEQNKLGRAEQPNEEWKFWRDLVWDNDKGRVPVFYLLAPEGNGYRLRAFGLAMMFRLAYRHSVWEAVSTYSQPEHRHAAPDYVEALFGHASDEKRADAPAHEQALKGRVSVGNFVLQGAAQLQPQVRVVLGSPKASYYPNYIEQRPDTNGEPGALPATAGGRAQYQTFMADPNKPGEQARIRGWKRYRPIDGIVKPPMPTKGDGAAMDTSNVETKFTPIGKGAKFSGKIRFHNLRPHELGSLLWALTLGGDNTAYHRIGMARSLGYGTVRLRVTGLQARSPGGVTPTAENLTEAFVAHMNGFTQKQLNRSWDSTPQYQELLALARPIPVSQARHMLINNGDADPRRRNEFTFAKSEGLALRSASRWDDLRRRGYAVGFTPVPRRGDGIRPVPLAGGGYAPPAVPTPLPQHGAGAVGQKVDANAGLGNRTIVPPVFEYNPSGPSVRFMLNGRAAVGPLSIEQLMAAGGISTTENMNDKRSRKAILDQLYGKLAFDVQPDRQKSGQDVIVGVKKVG